VVGESEFLYASLIEKADGFARFVEDDEEVFCDDVRGSWHEPVFRSMNLFIKIKIGRVSRFSGVFVKFGHFSQLVAPETMFYYL